MRRKTIALTLILDRPRCWRGFWPAARAQEPGRWRHADAGSGGKGGGGAEASASFKALKQADVPSDPGGQRHGDGAATAVDLRAQTTSIDGPGRARSRTAQSGQEAVICCSALTTAPTAPIDRKSPRATGPRPRQPGNDLEPPATSARKDLRAQNFVAQNAVDTALANSGRPACALIRSPTKLPCRRHARSRMSYNEIRAPHQSGRAGTVNVVAWQPRAGECDGGCPWSASPRSTRSRSASPLPETNLGPLLQRHARRAKRTALPTSA